MIINKALDPIMRYFMWVQWRLGIGPITGLEINARDNHFSHFAEPSFLHISKITTINTTMLPLTNANSAHGDKLTTAQFTFIYPTPGCGFVMKKAQCKHCTIAPRAWNITTNQGPHLKICEVRRNIKWITILIWYR
jgi:hypothetical protein